MRNYSRQDYTDGKVTHHGYYIQFANRLSWIKSYVESKWTPEQIRELYAKDKNLNNLFKGWLDAFDAVTIANKSSIASVGKILNGQNTYSLSDGTCAIKAYMREYAGIMECKVCGTVCDEGELIDDTCPDCDDCLQEDLSRENERLESLEE